MSSSRQLFGGQDVSLLLILMAAQFYYFACRCNPCPPEKCHPDAGAAKIALRKGPMGDTQEGAAGLCLLLPDPHSPGLNDNQIP